MADQGELKKIRVDQLDIDLSNYRHKPFKRPSQAIEYLVTKERVIDLAEDIAKEGTNPMDLLGVIRKSGSAENAVYTSVEGNRRVCALVLLHDPERIPAGVVGRAKMIKRLEKAAERATLSTNINAIVFKSKRSAKPWIDRMHIRDGRLKLQSRRAWSADQQERAMGGGRNRDAAALLDEAVKRGLITQEERASKLTTVQRYIGNPTMRKSLGIIRNADQEYQVERNIEDFVTLMRTFIADVRDGNLSSRSNAADVIRYSDELIARTGVTDVRGNSVTLRDACAQLNQNNSTKDPASNGASSGDDDSNDGESSEEEIPIRPRTTIAGSAALETVFAKYGSQKLQSLYKSCASLALSTHTPLITVGLWSLVESLAALHGGDGTKFDDYFNHNRLDKEFGFSNRDERKNVVASLKRLNSLGNSTKHSAIAASFDGQQLANDFDVLSPLIKKVLESLSSSS